LHKKFKDSAKINLR